MYLFIFICYKCPESCTDRWLQMKSFEILCACVALSSDLEYVKKHIRVILQQHCHHVANCRTALVFGSKLPV